MQQATQWGPRRSSRAVGLAVAVVLAGTVAGCGGGDADTGAPNGTTAAAAGEASGELRLSSKSAWQPGYDALIKDFERENPNVEVDVEYVPTARYGSLLNTQFQGGNAPDVVAVAAGRIHPPSVLDLGTGGQLVDQSSAEWAGRVPEVVSDLVTVDGSVYGWPVSVLTTAYVYNRDIMKEMGLEAPRTFAELLDACRTIREKDPDIVPVGWGGANAPSLAGGPVVFASSDVYANDPDWNAKRAAGKTTFAGTPGWKRAVTRIKELHDAKCFSEGVAADTPEALVGAFARGKIAMFKSGDTQLASLRAANADLDLGMFPAPADTQEQTYLTVYPNDAVAVSGSSKNGAAAQAFVDFLAEPENSSRLAAANAVVAPTDYERAAEEGAAKVLGEDHQAFEPYLERTMMGGSSTWPTTEIAAAMGEAVQGMFTGQRSVDDVLKAADDAWPKQQQR